MTKHQHMGTRQKLASRRLSETRKIAWVSPANQNSWLAKQTSAPKLKKWDRSLGILLTELKKPLEWAEVAQK